MTEVQYISDANGKPADVIVPIELCDEIESETETAYLLKSVKMRERILGAKERNEGIKFEDVREKLEI